MLVPEDSLRSSSDVRLARLAVVRKARAPSVITRELCSLERLRRSTGRDARFARVSLPLGSPSPGFVQPAAPFIPTHSVSPANLGGNERGGALDEGGRSKHRSPKGEERGSKGAVGAFRHHERRRKRRLSNDSEACEVRSDRRERETRGRTATAGSRESPESRAPGLSACLSTESQPYSLTKHDRTRDANIRSRRVPRSLHGRPPQ